MNRLEYYLSMNQKIFDSIEASSIELQKSILFTSLPILGAAIAFANTLTTVSDLHILKLSGGFLVTSVIGVILWYWSRIITLKFFQNNEEYANYLLGKREEFELETENITIKLLLGIIFLWILPVMCTLSYIVGISLISAFFYYNFPS